MTSPDDKKNPISPLSRRTSNALKRFTYLAKKCVHHDFQAKTCFESNVECHTYSVHSV